MDVRIYKTIHGQPKYIIIEYSLSDKKITGQTFYLFKNSENNNYYNKKPIRFNETLTPEKGEFLKKHIEDRFFDILWYPIEEIKEITDYPYDIDHFKLLDFDNFLPIGFEKDTYKYLIRNIKSDELKKRFELAERIPNNKDDKGSLVN